jgi:hypothetical protein
MPPTCRSRRRPLAGGLAAGVVIAVTAGGMAAAAVMPTSRPAPPASQPASGRPDSFAGQAAADGQAAMGQAGPGSLGTSPACGAAAPGYAACQALLDGAVHWYGTAWATGAAPASRPRNSPPPAASAPASAPRAMALAPFMAADLQAAYKLPSGLLGGRQTIAIVDAYDDPNAATDLAVYRTANHLPACGAAFGCFEKVNQQGQQGGYPPANADWALEESLDVDMVSAVCPNCKIILVEATNNSLANLYAAEDEAAKLGADVISNSWDAPEFAGEAAAGAAFRHPGVPIVAASGDYGFSASVPAAYGSVIAVGGTSLYRHAGSRGWAEDDWSGDGQVAAASGCSEFAAKPPWQHDRLCGTRTVADVAAVADPATPVAVYDTFRDRGWSALGGTSVATPIIAGVYALAGNGRDIIPGAWLYAHHGSLFDVTSGFEGTSGATADCGGSYLCTAARGYDGPTGWGTPDGIGAF